MIIAELRGRCRQSPIVLGGEGKSLGTKDVHRTFGHLLKPFFKIQYNKWSFKINLFTKVFIKRSVLIFGRA